MPASSRGPHLLPLSSPETASGAVPTGAWSTFPECPVSIFFSPFNLGLQPGGIIPRASWGVSWPGLRSQGSPAA